MKNNKGQSLIEVLFSITVVVLVLTGVVTLMVKVLNVRGEASLKNKASDLSTIIIENQIKEKNNNPSTFWVQSSATDQTMDGFTGFTGFTYDISKTFDINNDLNVMITIKWEDQTLKVERFFSRKGN